MPASNPCDVVVAGGGWSGLAAAAELTRGGRRVTLLEAAAQLGGRARRVPFDGQPLDNGQHLMLGAYRELLRLMAMVGLEEPQLFLRQRLDLQIIADGRPVLQLRPGALPAPLHLALGLIRANGLSVAERFQALGLAVDLLRTGFRIDADLPVSDWLSERRQPRRVVELLWEPLCVAALNTPLHRASARYFLRVLRETFARSRHDSDLLLPRRDLGALFPDPVERYLEQGGGVVHLRTRVTGLLVSGREVSGVMTSRGELRADRVVLALPPTSCARILRPHDLLAPVAERIGKLREEPICTVFLRYSADTSLGAAMVGLSGGLAQWLFDRGITGQPGVMAAVISASGPHMDLTNDALVARVRDEVARCFPHWPAPLGHRVIREKLATFACEPDTDGLRPANLTPLDGLLLAGDYTATGYPGTLEGAVRSGINCAERILGEDL